ncbi:MAG: hypothetical protein JF612_03940 [Planctomycetia bacterium]|jgi:hypothetical protein|nr:hypothetical protein [Planctomycetia bacterium]
METAKLVLAIALFALGTLVVALNVFLSFVRYPMHRWRGGTKENYRYASGLPLFGSLFLWGSAWLPRDNPAAMWIAILLSLPDTAGIPCCIVMLAYAFLIYRETPPTENGP